MNTSDQFSNDVAAQLRLIEQRQKDAKQRQKTLQVPKGLGGGEAAQDQPGV